MSLDFNYLPKFKSFQFEIVSRVPDWARVYGVTPEEVERHIGISHAWWVNNPKRGPKKDIMRYIHNFLAIVERKNGWRRQPPALYKDVVPAADMSVEEMIEIRKKNMGEL